MKVNSFLNASYTRVDSPYSTTNTPATSEKNEKPTQTTTELTTEQKALVLQLQATDSAVKAHERAHISAGAGVILSGASFVYTKAPDERLYAVGGEVSIDTGSEDNPNATIQKMQIVRTAALAPSDPSSTDYQVAATASMLQMQARLELSREKQAELIAQTAEKYVNNQDTEPLFSKYS